MNEVSDDFLAGTAFASNENRNIRGSNALDRADNVLHRGTLENRRSATGHRGERLAKRAGLFGELLVFKRAFDREKERFMVERLFLEIVSAKLRRHDGRVDCGEAGQNNYFGGRERFFDLRQEVEAFGIGKFQIQKNYIGSRCAETF